MGTTTAPRHFHETMERLLNTLPSFIRSHCRHYQDDIFHGAFTSTILHKDNKAISQLLTNNGFNTSTRLSIL